MKRRTTEAQAQSKGARSPQLERRRQIRREKRQDLLIQCWRIVALLTASAGLGWLLLRHGWTLEQSSQVVIQGDTGLRPELVARVGGLDFPQPLLDISPAELERRLLRDLPVRSARVERRGLPAQLVIALEGQLPIAHATRQRENRSEKGMVDARGHWIQPSADAPNRVPSSSLIVEGWTDDRRTVIAALLKERNAFGSPLISIALDPNGMITLTTKTLGSIDLGDDLSLLPEQIAVIKELSRSMPAHLGPKGKGTLDLSNPDRPELELPLKPAVLTPAKVAN